MTGRPHQPPEDGPDDRLHKVTGLLDDAASDLESVLDEAGRLEDGDRSRRVRQVLEREWARRSGPRRPAWSRRRVGLLVLAATAVLLLTLVPWWDRFGSDDGPGPGGHSLGSEHQILRPAKRAASFDVIAWSAPAAPGRSFEVLVFPVEGEVSVPLFRSGRLRQSRLALETGAADAWPDAVRIEVHVFDAGGDLPEVLERTATRGARDDH